ncbi:tripartite tricarboxylate transporter TctB family protein [Geosporobacter ferrireducens]|uniref:DUF1468 domain-containing protein n=1 Tax=Geosporobacter ferrireducens TaxID=1424294 RepID=A0A1D8GEY2_9FIRM|nr:tripartite tricarboxylate transporter TctB family protein [Geosporobacter ferrireducens]AOT69471.1 hypothetical protein Gferi_07740 [Geosporobacter ferrireducens]
MEKRGRLNSNIGEGIFFMIIGVALGFYSITSYSSSFNKDWSQSPYLFPILVAIFIFILSISLLIQGYKEKKLELIDTEEASIKKNNKGVIVILVMSILYYIALSKISLPRIIFKFSSFAISIATFEVVTVIFLLALLFYLGVRRVNILISVPVISVLFLSISFRTFLNVLLP